MRDYRRADRMLPVRWGLVLGFVTAPFWVLGLVFYCVHLVAEWLTWHVDDVAATLRRAVMRWSGVTARIEAEDAERRARYVADLRRDIALTAERRATPTPAQP